MKQTIALFLLAASTAWAGATPPPASVQVPVVLDVRGIGTSHFTSDLTVVNLGTEVSVVEFTYVASLGPGSTRIILSDQELGPKNRLYIPDVIAYLRERGGSLPDDGTPKAGTLLVRLPSLQDSTPPFVGSRISTPNGALAGGSFGTYSLGVPVGSGSTFRTSIYGLRENDRFRTNLALLHAGGGANAPIELRVQLYDALTGFLAGEPIVVALQPGQWKQISSVLSAASLSQGWAQISQSGGNDRYIAYAVVNDGGAGGGGTSDGSVIDTGASEGTLPIALSSGSFRTELVLANDSGAESLVNINYVSSDALGATPVTGSVRVTMPARTQIIEPDALAMLRRLGLGVPDSGPQGGTLRVSGAAALARVYSPNPDTSVGGTFGLSFPAVPSARRAHTEAFVYGLRQDGASRSNVAVANTVVTGEQASTFEVAIFAAATGGMVKSFTRSLKPGQWYQWNAVLADTGAGDGYARIRCTSVGGDFIAYGVVNDGAIPGAGTSDGSYIPMVNVK